MRIIKPDFEIWQQEDGLEGVYKMIERAGRVCYKSEDLIKEGSAEIFVDRMIKLGHGAMLEHGTIYLVVIPEDGTKDSRLWECANNKYSKINYESETRLNYITTNLRVLVENNWMDLLKYSTNPTKYHEKRVTVHFTTQIAITREFNRHRVNSMAEQSTRYCDYGGQGKRFEGVGVNLPSWITMDSIENSIVGRDIIADDKWGTIYERETYNWEAIDWWLWANQCCEVAYQKLRNLGWTSQQARTILPLDANTELVHTAFLSDWEHFFKLRDDKQHAHPDAFALANPLHQEFRCRGYIV